MAPVQSHVNAIHELFHAADERDILFWLGNGWAVDAMLGRITRAHEDIDLVYDVVVQERVRRLLESLGYALREWTDWGFVMVRDDVELDMDQCVRVGDTYTFAGYPPGCCPLEKNGVVAGLALRCTTWEALYLEMLHNQQEIPQADWRAKDFDSFALITAQVSPARQSALRALVGQPATTGRDP